MPDRDTLITLGRASSNDIVCRDEAASRHHAELRISEGRLAVRDLGSTNGTRVNESELPAHVWKILEAGHSIGIGGFVIRVELTEQVEPTSESLDYDPQEETVQRTEPIVGGRPEQELRSPPLWSVALRPGNSALETISSDPLVAKQMGPYRLESRLGSGASGSVYRASKGDLQVALKVILADGVQPSVKKRFKKEIESYTRLKHERVLRLLDWGEQGQFLYLATELHQCSLRDFLNEHGALIPEQASRLMLELLEAVAYLHEQQVVHRDLKPENILLAIDGKWILGDFGLAKPLESATFSTVGALGTLGYAAPEQLADEEVTRACDQYALGMIFFELLTGTLPFSTTGAGLAIEHLTRKVPKPSSRVDGVPPALDEITLRMTEKVAARRYSDLGQVMTALKACLPPDAGWTLKMEHRSGG